MEGVHGVSGANQVQHTAAEWAFLIPASQRLKARYMNLGPLIAWGVSTLAILDNPGPEVLNYGTRGRLEEKLGWLRQFREPLQGWSEMKQVIDVVLEFAHTQGLYRGAAKDLRKRLRSCLWVEQQRNCTTSSPSSSLVRRGG